MSDRQDATFQYSAAAAWMLIENWNGGEAIGTQQSESNSTSGVPGKSYRWMGLCASTVARGITGSVFIGVDRLQKIAPAFYVPQKIP